MYYYFVRSILHDYCDLVKLTMKRGLCICYCNSLVTKYHLLIHKVRYFDVLPLTNLHYCVINRRINKRANIHMETEYMYIHFYDLFLNCQLFYNVSNSQIYSFVNLSHLCRS